MTLAWNVRSLFDHQLLRIERQLFLCLAHRDLPFLRSQAFKLNITKLICFLLLQHRLQKLVWWLKLRSTMTPCKRCLSWVIRCSRSTAGSYGFQSTAAGPHIVESMHIAWAPHWSQPHWLWYTSNKLTSLATSQTKNMKRTSQEPHRKFTYRCTLHWTSSLTQTRKSLNIYNQQGTCEKLTSQSASIHEMHIAASPNFSFPHSATFKDMSCKSRLCNNTSLRCPSALETNSALCRPVVRAQHQFVAARHDTTTRGQSSNHDFVKRALITNWNMRVIAALVNDFVFTSWPEFPLLVLLHLRPMAQLVALHPPSQWCLQHLRCLCKFHFQSFHCLRQMKFQWHTLGVNSAISGVAGCVLSKYAGVNGCMTTWAGVLTETCSIRWKHHCLLLDTPADLWKRVDTSKNTVPSVTAVGNCPILGILDITLIVAILDSNSPYT